MICIEIVELSKDICKVMEEKNKQIKMLVMCLCLCMVLWFSSIIVFIWYINQYDYVSYEQDGNGINIVGDNNKEITQNEREMMSNIRHLQITSLDI